MLEKMQPAAQGVGEIVTILDKLAAIQWVGEIVIIYQQASIPQVSAQGHTATKNVQQVFRGFTAASL